MRADDVRDRIAQAPAAAFERLTGIDCHGLATLLAWAVVAADGAFALHLVSTRTGDPSTFAACVILVASAGASVTMAPSEDWRGPAVDHAMRALTDVVVLLFATTALACAAFACLAASVLRGHPELPWAGLACASQLGFAYSLLLRCCTGGTTGPGRVRRPPRRFEVRGDA